MRPTADQIVETAIEKVIILSRKLYFFVFLSTYSILFYLFALIKRKEQKQDAFAFVLLRMKSHQNLWTR